MEEAKTAEESDGESDQPPSVEASTLDAVIALVVRLLSRNLIALATPVILISGALTVPGFMILLMNLGGQAVIVNGELRPDDPKPELLITSFAVSAVLLVAHLVMVAMVVVMAAGVLLGHGVPPRPALLLVWRRSGPLLLLLALAGMIVLAVGAVMLFTPIVTHVWLLVAFALAVLAVTACWFLLTVPVVVLESAGAFRALSRLWEITRFRRTSVIWNTLLVGMLFPVLLGIAVRWLVSLPLSDIMQGAAAAVVATVTGVLTVLVQGATVAVVLLNQRHEHLHSGFWASPLNRVGLAEVATRLPAPVPPSKARPRRATALAAVALLVTPGVLYGGYLQANPLGLPSITDRPVNAGEYHNELVPMGGQRTAIITQSSTYEPYSGYAGFYNVQVCADSDCSRTSAFTYPDQGRDSVRSVPLPDGSMAVAWGTGVHLKDEVVRLMRCTVDGCPHNRSAETYPVIAKGMPNWPRGNSSGLAWDIAPSGEGIIFAALVETPEDRRKDDEDDQEEVNVNHFTVQVVRCADMGCAEPRMLASVPMKTSGWTTPPRVAIDSGAGNRPVVVFENPNLMSGSWSSFPADVAIITCEDAACRKPITRRPYRAITIFYHSSPQTELTASRLAVPPDDRPVLAYRDRENGAVRLLRCRTPDCARVDHVTLAGFGAGVEWDPYWFPDSSLDMALGPDGLPWIVTFDAAHHRLVFYACEVADCSRRSTMTLLTDVQPEGTLQMAMTRDGRPQVLWSYRDEGKEESNADDKAVNRLLTCRDARCGR
jgi:hypothetical protein